MSKSHAQTFCVMVATVVTTLTTALPCFSQQSTAKQPDATDNPIRTTLLARKRIAFLGDSITYSGGFLVTLESIIAANGHDVPQLLNLGLASETCSGDSETVHPFPRPDVHERLERLLQKVAPDLLVVNYGMNDGIYHPFDEKRFENFRQGINKIIKTASKAAKPPKIILVTPPPFDPMPLKNTGKLAAKDAEFFSWTHVYKNYDEEVLAVYADWILQQKSRVVACIDLRSPMLQDIAKRRESDADFRYADDGVHVDDAGHQLIGKLLAKAMGFDERKKCSQAIDDLIKQRQQLLRDSWLSEVGHKRPGVQKGIPISEALAQAEQLNRKIQAQRNENSSDK